MIWFFIALCSLLAGWAGYVTVLLFRERAKIKKVKVLRPNIDEMVQVMTDLNRLAGGMIEIRRVDPSSVFLYSPK